jgi:hypothetical protein
MVCGDPRRRANTIAGRSAPEGCGMTGDFVCIECGGRFWEDGFTATARGPECMVCRPAVAEPIIAERVDPQTIAMYRDLRPTPSGVFVSKRPGAVSAAQALTSR